MRKRRSDLLISIIPVTNYVAAEHEEAHSEFEADCHDFKLMHNTNQRYSRKNIAGANF